MRDWETPTSDIVVIFNRIVHTRRTATVENTKDMRDMVVSVTGEVTEASLLHLDLLTARKEISQARTALQNKDTVPSAVFTGREVGLYLIYSSLVMRRVGHGDKLAAAKADQVGIF